LGRADVTGIDFLVLARPKTVDIRGYLSFVDEEDHCPEDRVKNIVVELRKLGGAETDNEVVETKKLLLSCQFIYNKLEKAKYQVKLIEKQGKALTKVISDQVLDLTDDKDVNDGVKVHHVKIQKSKTSLQENINNTIFSPLIIALMVIGIFQWDYTVWILQKIGSIVSKK
jgi:hypothetical protein